jgi:glycosyltransferase involved in cell wall biosynthesis
VPEDRIVVLSIGRIVRAKGVYELVSAMSAARSQYPQLVCHIVGGMPGFDDAPAVTRFIAESGAGDRVRLFPACAPDRVWEYLCAADIFAFTSHREGMPNSLLEAMSMGLPVVAFGIPPVIDVAAGQEALLAVPPFDIPSLTSAIGRLATFPQERLRVGNLGRQRVAEAFSIERSMARAAEELSKVAVARLRARQAPLARERAPTGA